MKKVLAVYRKVDDILAVLIKYFCAVLLGIMIVVCFVNTVGRYAFHHSFRAAEEVIFNTVTTGAENDIEKATATVRDMITLYGMSERFGLMQLETIQSRYLDGRREMICRPNITSSAWTWKVAPSPILSSRTKGTLCRYSKCSKTKKDSTTGALISRSISTKAEKPECHC